MNHFVSMPTRRETFAGIAVALGSAFIVSLSRAQQPSMGQQPSENSADTRTSIHYELDFKSSPQRFYESIIDQKKFVAFSGMPATIDATAGGAFSISADSSSGAMSNSSRANESSRPGALRTGIQASTPSFTLN